MITTTGTERRFTAQRFDAATGLYYYDSTLGHFISPDTIVQDLGDPQAWF